MAGIGFGTSLNTQTTTTTPSFGFGSIASTGQTGTGGFSFGNPAKTTAPSYGFGSAFNPSASTGSSGFSFGGLGPTTSTAQGVTGLNFGTLGATNAANSGFSFGGLGTGTTTTGSGLSFGSLGSTGTSTSLFGGLGSTGTSTVPTFGGLGSTGTSTVPTFGGLGSTGTSAVPTFGGLGTTAGAPGGLFGNLGSTGTSSAFGGLGSTGTTFGSGTGLFGSSNAGPATVTNIASALLLLMVYGDERDTILAKWNQLQAFWGTGKGYFSSYAPPVDFTPENPFCRFKAIGYSCLPTNKPEEGHVSLIINKKDAEVHSQQQQLVDSLHRLLGSKPTLSVCVEGVRALPGVKTEVVIYLIERAPTGLSRRVPTYELQAFLEQNHIKTQLNSMGILSCIPRSAPTKDQLKGYLDNPPAGIDPLLWQQAKLDNPDPDHLIPVPMIGFTELHRRIKAQEQETKQHQERLDIIAEDISKLKQRHSTTLAKIADHKRKQLELGHRILKVIVCQEINRKLGFAIQADEEQLRVQLETLQTELNAPTQFKGRLNELISQLRMQNHQVSAYRETSHYTLEPALQEEIKEHLRYQQEGISHLISVLKDNMEDLRIIEEGFKEASDRRR